ncbi:MAG: sigma-70 family RNA polymerase sigma factor [Bacteroidota bacterium]
MFGKTKPPTEKELVAGCLKNDRRCQEALYRKFFPTMFRMCRRHTKSEDEAVEILNTGFMRVFTKLHTFGFKGSLEGWIRRLIFHSMADHYRKQNRKVRFLEIEDWDGPTSSTPLEKLYFDDIISLVDKLPKATREVFWLFAVEGYTHVDISKRLGISDGTSKWHLSNARKKLKELVKQEQNKEQRYAR